jgi:hypothetical protein
MNAKIPPTDNLAYHAARLLILIGHCGKPQSRSDRLPAIEGRTLLAKLDFFMRYPSYLKRAAAELSKPCTDADLGLLNPEDLDTIEARMIRYLYGPWDSIYYVTLAYLVGKRLIEPTMAGRIDTFRLTERGRNVLYSIENDASFSDLVRRADTIYHLFNAYTGSRLKQFIYDKFPEVVQRGLGERI